MSPADFRSWLESRGACTEALEWLGDRDLRQAWAECERGDWLLWLAGRLVSAGLAPAGGGLHRALVQAACDCAELAWPHVKDTDVLMACMLAVHVAREWCDGRADIEDVKSAGAATYAYAYAYATDAAYAAYATDAAAAAYAAYAADAAADAAYARKAVLKEAAKLVRARIPVEAIETAIAAEGGAA